MKKKALALSIITFTIVAVAVSAYLVHNQFRILQNNVNNLQAQRKDLQDEKRSLLYEINDLEDQNDALIKQIGDLTEQLALERALSVDIVSLSTEDRWSEPFQFLGSDRATNRFNVTIQNNDVVAVGGLLLTVRTLSGSQGVGMVFTNRTDILEPGEKLEIKGEAMVMTHLLKDLTIVATLTSGGTVIDEARQPLTTEPYQ